MITRMHVTTGPATGLLVTLLLTLAAPTQAQTIQCTLVDDEWSVPIETAGVSLLAEATRG